MKIKFLNSMGKKIDDAILYEIKSRIKLKSKDIIIVESVEIVIATNILFSNFKIVLTQGRDRFILEYEKFIGKDNKNDN